MGARILVVDDDEAVLEFLKKVLELDGHQIEISEHGVHAMELVATRPFDLLIVDKNLPGMNGLEFIAIARRAAGEVPAILITAYPEPILTPTVKLQGYLSKPFEGMAKIREAVSHALWLKEVREKTAPRVSRRT